jgi:hypothetical protein
VLAGGTQLLLCRILIVLQQLGGKVLMFWFNCHPQVCLAMEAAHPDSFKPQLPQGYTRCSYQFFRALSHILNCGSYVAQQERQEGRVSPALPALRAAVCTNTFHNAGLPAPFSVNRVCRSAWPWRQRTRTASSCSCRPAILLRALKT